ncbi:MAG: Gfo/Idh/MocA family oxidoreductase [Pseudomonadota bacterium]
MTEIGIGIIGGGYMGKAHSVAMSAVGAAFETKLRPRLEMIAASSPASAARYAKAFGFARAAENWQSIVADPKIEAVIIASPQRTHRAIAEAAFSAGKAVFCEKPLGATLEDARAMAAAAEASGLPNMIGFNYSRTPATQYARKLIADGEIGQVTWIRCEHTEDFYADPELPAGWRTEDEATGAVGDLAPHPINCALALGGPIQELIAEMETVHAARGGVAVRNDDQLQMMCRFQSGAMGHLFSSRIAHGRKMGYIYEVTGTKGAIRFDQEDQNAIWLYRAEGPEAEQGFTKILTGPAHPDYLAFCQGPGHGTGYQDQIIIEAKDFLTAIETGKTVWPSFRDGLAVAEIVDVIRRSSASKTWQKVVTTEDMS